MHIHHNSYLPHLGAITSIPTLALGYFLLRYAGPNERIWGYVFLLAGLFSLVTLTRLLTRPGLGLWLKPDALYQVTVRYTVSFPWTEVTGIEPAEYRGQQLILVFLSHPDKFVDQYPVWLRAVIRRNLDVLGTPVVINPKVYRGNPEDLYRQILSAYYSYR